MIERGIIMRKLGKGTLLLVSAVMAAALFTGCGKENSQGITTQRSRKVINQCQQKRFVHGLIME